MLIIRPRRGSAASTQTFHLASISEESPNVDLTASLKSDHVYDPDLEKIGRDIRKAFRKYTRQYFRDAKDTNEIPTEDNAVAQVLEDGEYLFNGNKNFMFLNTDDQKKVRAACREDIEDNIRSQYRSFMDKYHFAVNDGHPYHIEDSEKEEVDEYISIIDQQVRLDLNRFLNQCAQEGVCPNEPQVATFIRNRITDNIKLHGPDWLFREHSNGAKRRWLQHKLEELIPEHLKTYHAFAGTVRVTNSYPSTYPGVSTPLPSQGTKQVPPTSGGEVRQPVRPEEPKTSMWAKTNVSFSGCDMVVSANMTTTEGKVVSVVMGSLQTISYSIYRKLSPINCIGNVNAKDYVGGPRTVAGSLVFTVFHQHWATELVNEFAKAEGYASNRKLLMDELAPIDLTIAMANEYGVNSRLAIYGVRLFSEGQVMSINDIYTENTFEYVALNVDYLANVNAVNDIWTAYANSPAYKEYLAKVEQIQAEMATPPVKRDGGARTTTHTPETEKPSEPQKTEPKAQPASKQEGDAEPGREAPGAREQTEDPPDTIEGRIGKEGEGEKETDTRQSVGRKEVKDYFAGFDLKVHYYSEFKGRKDALAYVAKEYQKYIDNLDAPENAKMTTVQKYQQKRAYKTKYEALKQEINRYYDAKEAGNI